MSLIFPVSLIVVTGVILERSIFPMVTMAGATFSPLATAVGALSLLGFLEPALIVTVFGGLLLDLLAPQPFGRETLTLFGVWVANFLASRYRLLTAQLVVVAATMTVVGVIVALPQFLLSFDFLYLVSSALLHALVGPLLFPLFRRLFPHEEIITLGRVQ